MDGVPTALIFHFIRSGFNPATLATWLMHMVALLLAVSLHEVAHGYAAYRMGDPTAKEAGRLTLDPMAHFDIVGAILILIGAPIAWAKPVPIQPARFDRQRNYKRALMLVAIAGILTNIVTSFLAYILFNIFGFFSLKHDVAFLTTFTRMLAMFFMRFHEISIWLAVFNLLPVPPLDGFKFFGQFFPQKVYYALLRRERQIGFAFLLLIVLGGPLLSRLLSFLSYPIYWLIRTPVDALFALFL